MLGKLVKREGATFAQYMKNTNLAIMYRSIASDNRLREVSLFHIRDT